MSSSSAATALLKRGGFCPCNCAAPAVQARSLRSVAAYRASMGAVRARLTPPAKVRQARLWARPPPRFKPPAPPSPPGRDRRLDLLGLYPHIQDRTGLIQH